MYSVTGNWTGDVMKATEDDCLYLEVDNAFKREYNERMQKTCAAMEAYVLRCIGYQCKLRCARAYCDTCKTSVYHRSASTSLAYPSCANRKPISDEPPASQPVSTEVTILTKLMDDLPVHNEYMDEGTRQARVQYYADRIRMANATTRLGLLRAERKAINDKFRDLRFNYDLLHKYTAAWKVYMTKVIKSPLHCPRCYAQVKVAMRKVQGPRQPPRAQVKVETTN